MDKSKVARFLVHPVDRHTDRQFFNIYNGIKLKNILNII